MNRSSGDALQSLAPLAAEESDGVGDFGGMRPPRFGAGAAREHLRPDDHLGWHDPHRDLTLGRGCGAAATQLPPRGFGRRPEGYMRSDEHVRDEVCERLPRSRRVDASAVSVEVSGGTVSLQGSVSERRMKHDTEVIIEHCFGVRDIDNRIRVNRGSLEP